MYSDGLLKLRIFTIQKNFKILLTVYSLSPHFFGKESSLQDSSGVFMIRYSQNFLSDHKWHSVYTQNATDCRQSPAFAGFCYCWSRFSDIINIRRAVFFYDDQKRR